MDRITRIGHGIAAAALLTCNVAMARPGDLDTTFGTGGIVHSGSPIGMGGGNGVARATDGKLVVAGFGVSGGLPTFQVARFNPNGTGDATFGGGTVSVAVGTGLGIAVAAALQADGKVVACGVSELLGSNPGAAIVRLNDNGSLDTTFAGTGKILLQVGNGQDTCNAVAIQADGKIVVAGDSADAGVQRFFAARYNTNGTLDGSFG
jgi:uncharacterized delta-60 repeat protein